MTFQTLQHTEALGPIFRYVAQYTYIVIYLTESVARTRLLNYLRKVVLLFVQNVFLNEDGVWRENCPWQFKRENTQATIANDMLLNMFDIESYQRTASLEQRLLNYLWPCDLRAVVNVRTLATAWRELWDQGPPRHFEHWIPKLRGYFDMLLNMLYFKTYRRQQHRSKVLITFGNQKFSRSFQNLLLNEEVWRKTVHANSNIENTQATRPIFRYVAQYVPYWNLSNGQRPPSKGCELPLTLSSSCGCKCRDCHAGNNCMEELWQESSPWHFKHGKYRCYEANISKLFSMIQYKWNCLCYLMTWYLENEGEVAFAIAIVDHRLLFNFLFSEGVRLADKSIRMENFGIKALHDISNLPNTQATRPIFRYVAQYVLFRIISERWRRSSKIVELPFRLDVFAVRSRTSVWRRREFWQEHFSWHFKHATYRSFGAIFRYVLKYIIYRNISEKRRTKIAE